MVGGSSQGPDYKTMNRRNIDQFKENILKDYPRLGTKDTFTFRCHKGLKCFTTCCSDVNIFLTPYDLLRMKTRLRISSGEFLSTYAITLTDGKQLHPVVLLKMRDDDAKTCPFVTKEGCAVYENRPWACRMYPLGVASPKTDEERDGEQFYFMLEETDCLGRQEHETWTVGEWMQNQEVSHYDEMSVPFKEITLHDLFLKGDIDPAKMEMFFMACYDIDRFRRFVFDSTFLQRFQIDNETITRMKQDDTELLKLAFDWVKFFLLGERTLTPGEHTGNATT